MTNSNNRIYSLFATHFLTFVTTIVVIWVHLTNIAGSVDDNDIYLWNHHHHPFYERRIDTV